MKNEPTFLLKFETDDGEEIYFQATSMKFSSLSTLLNSIGIQDSYYTTLYAREYLND